MPETGPEVGPEAGVPKEERKALTPKERALRSLKETFGRLKEKGVSLPAFRKRLEAQARGEEEKDPDIRKAVSEIKSLVKAEQREEKELTDVEKVREAIEVLSRDPSLSPEQRERVEREKTRLAEFEAREMMGEISPDPEKRAEQLGRILTGVEGVKLARAVAEVAAEEIPPKKTPYPRPKPLRISGGEIGWRGRGRLVGGVIAVPLVVTATCVLGGVFWGRISHMLSPEGHEEYMAKKASEVQLKGGEALILGEYLYRDLERTEQRKKDLARQQLDSARDLLVEGAYIDGELKKYGLNDVKDPKVAARLIYEYQDDYPYVFSLNQIEDLKKRKKVEEFLKEFEEKEVEETGYKSSLRKTAEARAKQRRISAQARARGVKISSRRERGLT